MLSATCPQNRRTCSLPLSISSASLSAATALSLSACSRWKALSCDSCVSRSRTCATRSSSAALHALLRCVRVLAASPACSSSVGGCACAHLLLEADDEDFVRLKVPLHARHVHLLLHVRLRAHRSHAAWHGTQLHSLLLFLRNPR